MGAPFSLPCILALYNSFCRTYTSACSAVYTCISIDFILGISFGNCLYWTLSSACSAAYTFISNNVCHDFILLRDIAVVAAYIRQGAVLLYQAGHSPQSPGYLYFPHSRFLSPGNPSVYGFGWDDEVFSGPWLQSGGYALW